MVGIFFIIFIFEIILVFGIYEIYKLIKYLKITNELNKQFYFNDNNKYKDEDIEEVKNDKIENDKELKEMIDIINKYKEEE